MRELSALLEWPHGIARLGVILCVSLAIVLGVVYFVRAVDRLGDDAARNAATNYDDREFAGGNSLVADKGALYEARGRIPEDGTYRVLVGPRAVEGATELTKPYIDQFARSFLMPRRPAADAPLDPLLRLRPTTRSRFRRASSGTTAPGSSSSRWSR